MFLGFLSFPLAAAELQPIRRRELSPRERDWRVFKENWKGNRGFSSTPVEGHRLSRDFGGACDGRGVWCRWRSSKELCWSPFCYKCQILPPRNVEKDSFLTTALATTFSSIACREMEKGAALSASPPRTLCTPLHLTQFLWSEFLP